MVAGKGVPEHRELSKQTDSQIKQTQFEPMKFVTFENHFVSPMTSFERSFNIRDRVSRDLSPSRQQRGLLESVLEGDVRRCEKLLRNGDSPECRDEHERSALYWAAAKGNRHLCELLILFGALVDGKSMNGATALHGATECGSVECADLLIKRGADVNRQTREGDTPLHFAAYHGRYKMVSFLLQHADSSVTNTRLMTPLDEAKQRGHRDIVELFSKLRVHLPLSRRPAAVTSSVAQKSEKIVNDRRRSSGEVELNDLSIGASPTLLVRGDLKSQALTRVLHDDVQRSVSLPTSPNYYNIPARNFVYSQPIPGKEQSSRKSDSLETRSVVESGTAQNLRQENAELRSLCDDLQIKLALARDEIETLKRSSQKSCDGI